MEEEWLETDGSCIKLAGSYRISGASGNGSIEVIDADLKIENGKTFVRKGSTASNTVYPSQIDVSNREATLSSRTTYCIALLLYRCSDHKLVGGCIGAWDCGG